MKPTLASVPAPRLPTSSCQALEFELQGQSHHVQAFVALVNREFRAHRTLGYYARELKLTPNHLNALCRRHLQQTASALVHARVIGEAKRQLGQSGAPVGAVARTLGFADASYFGRYFKKHVLLTPLAFRQLNPPAEPRH